jgi:hypothetical protein
VTVEFTADSVIASARSSTGLRDFGGDFFYDGLRALVASIHSDARLTDAALQSKHSFLVGLIANRLRADQLFAQQPQILEQPLGALHVVTGLPRGGTTKLHSLLSRHPDCNFLTTWQALQPVPHSEGKVSDGDERRATVAAYLGHRKAQAPTFDAIHEVSVDGPEEDGRLMQHTMYSMAFFDMNLASYTEWLAQQDLAPAYADLGRWLRLLQWQNDSIGRPWMLKNVFHVNDLATLDAAFPGVKVVWAHRHPRENLPSWGSLVHTLRAPLSEAEDARTTGLEQVRYWSRAMRRGIQQRAAIGESAFLDVHYADLLSDSRAVLERTLKFFGEDASHDVLDGILEWERDNPQHKHGRHHYCADDFGMSDAVLDSAFEQYVAHFSLG